MRRPPRGGPGEFAARLARAHHLLDEVGAGAARQPLTVLAAVLRHQEARATELSGAATSGTGTGCVPRRGEMSAGGPLLDLEAAPPLVAAELGPAIEALHHAVPGPLAQAGRGLGAMGAAERAAVAGTWLDEPDHVEPRLAFWLHVAAAPVLEPTAQRIATSPEAWSGRACPRCGGHPQTSVIAEESGEFMAGSPRSLVCGRCAGWWPCRRAACAACGEEDPRQQESFLDEKRPWARVDTCTRCRSYVKTFDLRQPGAVDVVPLVDDLATLTLDVWARERGFTRASASLAGV